MQFSALWVCGMSDRYWPPMPQPNPFLPVNLQRQYNMPHASPQREMDYARLQIKRLSQSADTVVFSYPEIVDEQPAMPSALLTGLGEKNARQFANPCITQASLPLEAIHDLHGPPLAVDKHHSDMMSVKTGVIRDQSQCPFRAFVRHRLSASKPESLEEGMNPLTRGNLVHQVMERLWREWGNLQGLSGYSEDQINKQLLHVIDEVVDKEITMDAATAELEKQRLYQLLHQWIAIEKQRQPFSVRSLEHQTSCQLGRLSIAMRIDRIDILEDGSLSIIDYKTGRTTIKSWCGDRPEEPQLPLYALSYLENDADPTVNSIMFANIRAGEHQWLGLTAEKEVLVSDSFANKNIKQIPLHRGACQVYPDWQALVESWRKNLAKIAETYVAGEADIDPVHGSRTCQYCDLISVCRIFDND